MNRSMIAILASALISSAAIGGVIYHHNAHTNPPPEVLAGIPQSQGQSADSVSVTTPPPAAVLNLVTVDHTFGEDTSDTRFVTQDDGSFSTIGSVTDQVVTSDNNVVKLPSDFSNVGIKGNTMVSDQPITITQRYAFQTDGSIIWELSSGNTPNYTWNQHPSALSVKLGQTAVVTYTSKDKGSTWVGDVQIVG